MTPEQQVALDAMRSAWPEEVVQRMLRAEDGRIEAAVVDFRKASDFVSPDEDEANVWEINAAHVAAEKAYGDASFALRTASATIEGMTPPCARCRLSGWIGDGVPCPDCDGNPQERIEVAG